MCKAIHSAAPCMLALAASLAAGQSASVTVSASDTTVAPGGSITVSIQSDFDTNGAGSGLFGASGFFGFGGTVSATGAAAGDFTASMATLNGDLAFGPVASVGSGAQLATAAAGRGLAGGLATNPGDLLTFTVDVDANAPTGDVTLDFSGAVVLVEGSNLVTYATDPGLNQQSLTVNSLTITVNAGGCNDADIAMPFGILDLGDIGAFVGGFTSQDPIADIDGNEIFDLGDIGAFVSAFTAGCP